MRYYVKTLSGEKGPYELDEIRESLLAGRLAEDALLRPEDSTRTVSIAEVVPRGGTSAAAIGESGRRRRRAEGDVYAPPDETEDAPDSYVVRDPGSFGTGFVLGFFCGCFALVWALVSRNARPETKRGIFVGFGVGFAIGAVLRVLAMASHR